MILETYLKDKNDYVNNLLRCQFDYMRKLSFKVLKDAINLSLNYYLHEIESQVP